MYLQQTGANAIVVDDGGNPVNDTTPNLQVHPAYLTGLFTVVVSLPDPWYPLIFSSPITIPQQITPPMLTKGTQQSSGFVVQELKDSGRTLACFYATAHAAGATGVETLITLKRVGVSDATSFLIPSGKYFRLTNIIVASRGHNTATAQATTFSLRFNLSGAITTGSSVLFSMRTATPATANAWDRFPNPVPDGVEVIGDGVKQFGFTANSVFVTNAPTLDLILLGFEY